MLYYCFIQMVKLLLNERLNWSNYRQASVIYTCAKGFQTRKVTAPLENKFMFFGTQTLIKSQFFIYQLNTGRLKKQHLNLNSFYYLTNKYSYLNEIIKVFNFNVFNAMDETVSWLTCSSFKTWFFLYLTAEFLSLKWRPMYFYIYFSV